jgi:hypothetical protein
MSAIDQIESGQKPARNAGRPESSKLAPVANKLAPIFSERAATVRETIEAYNAAEDRFIAEQLGASSLEVGDSPLDVNALFA